MSDLVLTHHPLCSTHCIGHHHTEAVPVITGIRIPYLDPDTPIELVIKRAQCALMLFRPYRGLLDLVSDRVSETAGSVAYFQWEPTRTHFAREIMANMDYYYHTAKIAQEDGEFGSNELANEHNSDELFGTRDIVDDTTGNMQRDSEAATGVGRTDEFCQIFADEADATMADDGSRLPIFPTVGIGSMLSSIVHRKLLVKSAERTVRVPIDLGNHEHTLGLSVGKLQEWVKDSATDEIEPSLSNRPRLERSADVVELIQHALESEHEWLPPKEQPDSLPPIRPHPTVNDVATVFTLNRRQHVASSLIAAALLRRFQQQELANAYESADYRSSEIESRLRGNQLLMFLGGAGGTGNSRVIDAVSAFCSDSNTMVIATLTGKAATLICGRTLASFLVRLEHAIIEKKFAPLDLLVIDEISMMIKSKWLKLDKLLRRYMQIENVRFGGIHIVLVGDFLQMPPVKSDPIYLDPRNLAQSMSEALSAGVR